MTAGASFTRRTGKFCVLLLLALTATVQARPLRVASKTFTESVILADIACDLEEAGGIETTHRAGLGGTRLVWDALVAGSVDVYPEYTGTLVHEILGLGEVPADKAAGRALLTDALAKHGIGMTAPLGFDNTYAVGLTSERARALGVHTITDLGAHPELKFGFSNEFLSRKDGWPALRDRYGLAQTDVQGLDHDLAYRALVSGGIDATDLYTTDAEVKRYALAPLVDDRAFFQRYEAVFLYRKDVPRSAALVLAKLEGRIDAPSMSDMNARAKLDRVAEADVASGFVQSRFGIAPRARSSGLWRSILQRTLEHLVLVGISLAAAVLVAVPLGIVAQRRRRVGQVVLALVGVVQTLPTLALLVFMIPLFGIGGLPAIVALFLYSLLPIVRNTHAGLNAVAGSLLESARALGLPPSAILRRIELPLASPMILAGIKSAAVINVGTATLGALVGAGGLGQPVFTGIRLDDIGLVFQGAIPASLLALAVQGLFELVERRVVPRGLRL